jgi:acyl carrier protein
MTNLEKYNQIFLDVFNIESDVLNEEFSFNNVSTWDSIAHMGLIAQLEEEFDVMLDTEDILNFGSYENGKGILTKNDIEL